MVCKVNSIFDEIFKIYVNKKSGFTDFVKEILKYYDIKMSVLNKVWQKKELLQLGQRMNSLLKGREAIFAFTTIPAGNTRKRM